MFFIELMASRFDIFGEQDLEAADPAMGLIRGKSAVGEKASGEEAPYQNSKSHAFPENFPAALCHVIEDTVF
jgi:hypothetical protein